MLKIVREDFSAEPTVSEQILASLIHLLTRVNSTFSLSQNLQGGEESNFIHGSNIVFLGKL